MFDPLWRRRLNTFRRVLVENLGVRGVRDVASWGVAFAAAYWIWIRPAQKEREQEKVTPLQKRRLEGANFPRLRSSRLSSGQSKEKRRRSEIMVLGFDNTGLLIALTFGAVVLKPRQLTSAGRLAGRAVGRAVGYLTLLREQLSQGGKNSEFSQIRKEVQTSMSTLNSIEAEIRQGTRIFGTPPVEPQAEAEVERRQKMPPTKPLPVSAGAVGMQDRQGDKGGVRFGSEIMLQAILEEEVARRAQSFMESGDPQDASRSRTKNSSPKKRQDTDA